MIRFRPWQLAFIIMLLMLLPSMAAASQTSLPQAYDEYLNTLDTGQAQHILEQNPQAASLLGEGGFLGFIRRASSGDAGAGFWQMVWPALKSALVANAGLCLQIIAAGIFCGILAEMRASFADSSVADAASYACYAVAVLPALSVVARVLLQSKEAVDAIVGWMNALFPVMTVLMTTLGSTSAAGVLQPAQALICQVILWAVQNIVMPLTLTLAVLAVVARLSDRIKLDKMESLIKSIIKWLMGAITVLFSGSVALQGFTAATYDNMAIRTAKYAVDTAVPVLGGMFSDTLESVMASSLLIKNSAGVAGVMVLAGMLLGPVIQIVSVIFLLRIASALLQPLGDVRLTDSLSKMADALQMMFLGVGVSAVLCFMLIAMALTINGVAG